MNRTIPAIAAALFAAMTFTSAAEACISCEYVPEVVRESSTSHGSHGSTYYRVKRDYTAAKVHDSRPAKRRIAKSAATAKKATTAAAAPAKTESTASIKTEAESENSTISTATLAASETAEVKEAPAAKTKANTNVGCKKFFPTVGMTLTVPCE